MNSTDPSNRRPAGSSRQPIREGQVPASPSDTNFEQEKTFIYQASPEAEEPKHAHGIPDRLGRFEIRGVLGQGGYGCVYLGFDSQLNRRVAIKVPVRTMTEFERGNLLQEARRVAQLRHHGIVTVFDIGEFDGVFCIVSDYVEGQSLREWMRTGAVTWRDAVRVVADLADALAHAHQHSTVHRDIKPSNVIVGTDGRPIILDFGLAISDDLQDQELPGIIAGTVPYMSPEQASGKAHRIDGRTDIYALGVVLYEIIGGRLPHRSNHLSELIRKICEDDPQPLRQLAPQIPPEVERVCHRAMSKAIGDRPVTASDFALELRHCLSTVPEASPVTQPVAAPESAETQSELRSPSDTKSDSRLSEAERRQVTAMFCEIDESSLGESDLDPEEIRDLQLEFQKSCYRIAAAEGGYVARRESDGILLYFGYPESYEDAVQRSVRAALAIQKEFLTLNGKLSNPSSGGIEFRMGIHTGIVVTEETAKSESGSSSRYNVVGNVPKVAASIARLAPMGQILVSPTVQRIIGSQFEVRSEGTHKPRGVVQPIELYTVVGASSQRRLPSGNRSRPLLGRDHEFRMLHDCWNRVTCGEGQMAMISAPAGIGKSRLVQAFGDALGESSLVMEASGSAYHQNTPLYPVIELLQDLLHIDHENRMAGRVEPLEALLEDLNLPVRDFVPALAELLSIPAGSAYPVFSGSPEARRQVTLELLTELMLAIAETKPTLLVFEDLHWMDPSTISLIEMLVEHCSKSQLLLLVTFRPSFVHEWVTRPNMLLISPRSLPPELTTELVLSITGNRPLPGEVLSHIRQRTDGVPLFIEEMTKAVLESGIVEERDGEFHLVGPIESLAIPETLNDSLMARLDRLGAAREVAQLGAIIGREFSYRLLQEVSEFNEDALKRSLKSLVDAELIHQRGFFPRARFTFKHALVQDAAYESLLKKTRQEWHGKIADVLKAQFSEHCESQPELLAHHFTSSGRQQEAIPYWTMAGLQAQSHSAYTDAIHHFRAALESISSLENPSEREQREFEQQIPLGVSLLSAKGYANPEVGPVFERARELSTKYGNPVQQFHILWGIWAWRVVREELTQCLSLCDDVFRLPIVAEDRGLRAEAEFMRGLTQFYRGEFAASQRHCEAVLEHYDEEVSRLHAAHTGQNVGVTARSYLSLSLWMLGQTTRALEVADEGIQLARKLKHPFSLAYALHHCGWLHQHARQVDRVLACADETLAIAQDQQFLFWIAEGNLSRGYGLHLQGNYLAAMESIQAGLKIFRLSGASLSLCHFYGMLAEIHTAAGRAAEGLQWLEKAFEASAVNGNVFYLAELHRIQGTVLKALGRDPAAVEECFRKSLEEAVQQSAKPWELRTTVSLAEHWIAHGKAAEARQVLAAQLQNFPASVRFHDPSTARKLLAQLEGTG